MKRLIDKCLIVVASLTSIGFITSMIGLYLFSSLLNHMHQPMSAIVDHWWLPALPFLLCLLLTAVFGFFKKRFVIILLLLFSYTIVKSAIYNVPHLAGTDAFSYWTAWINNVALLLAVVVNIVAAVCWVIQKYRAG